MTEVRKWEEMQMDCLVNIFGRVGIHSLLFDVPFVCKLWSRASFSPLCWQHIDITPELIHDRGSYSRFLRRFIYEYRIKNFSLVGFISMIYSRGLNISASRVLTAFCGNEELERVAEKCPDLKSISLNAYVCTAIPNVIGKLKLLEEIELDLRAGYCAEIVALIGHNCKNINSLIIRVGIFYHNDTLAIVKNLPKIKKLSMDCFIMPEDLEIILRSLKYLEYFNVSKCMFPNDWSMNKLRELALHVKTLNFNVGMYYIYSNNSDDEYGDYMV